MTPDPHHPYLGTSLTPADYYKLNAPLYDNPHAEGIASLLFALAGHLRGHVLDLGCGDGLISKLLAGYNLTFSGLDNAPAMVKRYTQETGNPGIIGDFTDPLPRCDSVVSSYALHLAPPAKVALLWWRLWESGASNVVVITPFKSRPAAPKHYFELSESIQGPFGPERKTLYGRAFIRLQEVNGIGILL
jgi:SAM-dependent methyltransferase